MVKQLLHQHMLVEAKYLLYHRLAGLVVHVDMEIFIVKQDNVLHSKHIIMQVEEDVNEEVVQQPICQLLVLQK